MTAVENPLDSAFRQDVKALDGRERSRSDLVISLERL